MSPIFLALILCPALALAKLDLSPYNVTALEYHDHVDLDKDGTINVNETVSYFQVYDTDQNDVVSLLEFRAHMETDHQEFIGYEAGLMKYYDLDDDGVLRQNDFELFFLRYDSQNDGAVTQAEFVGPYSEELQTIEENLNSCN